MEFKTLTKLRENKENLEMCLEAFNSDKDACKTKLSLYLKFINANISMWKPYSFKTTDLEKDNILFCSTLLENLDNKEVRKVIREIIKELDCNLEVCGDIITVSRRRFKINLINDLYMWFLNRRNNAVL